MVLVVLGLVIFEDIFGDFAGRTSARSSTGPARGADMQYTIQVSLEDAYSGKDAQIKIPVNDTCGTCNGTGAKPGTGSTICKTCDGVGRVRQQQGFFTIERTCPTCHGQGRIISDPCDTCGGEGRTQRIKTLKVKIPPGVDQGRRMRLVGEGEAGLRGGPAGDLYVLITMEKHRFFKRDGANLHCRVPISVTKAALGGEVEVPTIAGKRTKVKIPPGTQTGQQFRLRGKGMSVLRSDSKGDMYIETFVETPVNLNKKQKDLLQQLDKTMSHGKSAQKHSPESEGFFTKMKEMWDDLTD